jgi:ribonucleoside-triphosphate reductase
MSENKTCGQKTEVYSRVTGFYRPVQAWNDGKQQEFKDRKFYKTESAKNIKPWEKPIE